MSSRLRLMCDFGTVYEVNKCSGGQHNVEYVDMVLMN